MPPHVDLAHHENILLFLHYYIYLTYKTEYSMSQQELVVYF